MTRGAAANAILDAGRSKKRLPSPPPPSLFLPGLRYNLSVFLPTTLSLVVRPPLLLTRGGLFPLSLLSFLALHAFARAPPPPSFCLFILSRPLVPSLSHSLRSSLSRSVSHSSLPSFASFYSPPRFLALCTPNEGSLAFPPARCPYLSLRLPLLHPSFFFYPPSLSLSLSFSHSLSPFLFSGSFAGYQASLPSPPPPPPPSPPLLFFSTNAER